MQNIYLLLYLRININETETPMNLANSFHKILTLFIPTLLCCFNAFAGPAEDLEMYGIPTTVYEKGLCIAVAGANVKYRVQTVQVNEKLKATVYLITDMAPGRIPGTVVMFQAARMAISEVTPRMEGTGWVIEGPNILKFKIESIRNSVPKFVKLKIIATTPMSGLINNSIPIKCNP